MSEDTQQGPSIDELDQADAALRQQLEDPIAGVINKHNTLETADAVRDSYADPIGKLIAKELTRDILAQPPADVKLCEEGEVSQATIEVDPNGAPRSMTVSCIKR